MEEKSKIACTRSKRDEIFITISLPHSLSVTFHEQCFVFYPGKKRERERKQKSCQFSYHAKFSFFYFLTLTRAIQQ
jgi:hypothetical protein